LNTAIDAAHVEKAWLSRLQTIVDQTLPEGHHLALPLLVRDQNGALSDGDPEDSVLSEAAGSSCVPRPSSALRSNSSVKES